MLTRLRRQTCHLHLYNRIHKPIHRIMLPEIHLRVQEAYHHRNPNRMQATRMLNQINRRFKDSLRGLIDPGSDASFITENAAQLLRLNQRTINDSVSGIGNVSAGRILQAYCHILVVQLRIGHIYTVSHLLIHLSSYPDQLIFSLELIFLQKLCCPDLSRVPQEHQWAKKPCLVGFLVEDLKQ